MSRKQNMNHGAAYFYRYILRILNISIEPIIWEVDNCIVLMSILIKNNSYNKDIKRRIYLGKLV